VTPASAGPATPPSNYQGISGDPSWAKIGAGTAESRPRGGVANSGAPRPTPRANGAANPNAPKFNPYADDDLPSQPGRRGEGEGFLSAKDLAAAFNLGFVGEEDDDDPRAAAAQRGGRNARGKKATREEMSFSDFSAMGMGGGGNYGVPSGRSKLKIAFAIIVLLVMGLGVALAVSSDLRQAIRKWFTSATAGLNKESDADQLGSPGSNQRKLNGPGKAPRQPAEPPTEVPPTRPARPATSPGGDSEESATPASATQPAVFPPGHTTQHVSTPATPPSPPVAPPAPATKPVAVAPADHPSSPATVPAAPPARVPWSQSEAAKLYREGIALENSNPPLSLSRYKEIQRRFPPDSWPTDLNDRIKRMTEKVKEAVRRGELEDGGLSH
jgi:hypothetical protein